MTTSNPSISDSRISAKWARCEPRSICSGYGRARWSKRVEGHGTTPKTSRFATCRLGQGPPFAQCAVGPWPCVARHAGRHAGLCCQWCRSYSPMVGPFGRLGTGPRTRIKTCGANAHHQTEMMLSKFSSAVWRAAPPVLHRRREELQSRTVRVTEAQAGTVRSVDDSAVSDAELVQSTGPLLQFFARRACEGDVVQANSEFTELFAWRGLGVLMQTEQCVVLECEHDVPVAGVGVLVDHRLGPDEPAIPGRADGEVPNGDGDVSERGECWHVNFLVGSARRN